MINIFKNKSGKVLTMLASAFVLLGVSANAWSSSISSESPLDPSYYAVPNAPRVDMTNIKLNYFSGGKSHHGNSHHGDSHRDSLFFGRSQSSSAFTLVKPDFSTATFGNAIFGFAATLSSHGTSKGIFTIRSSDPMFGFGQKCFFGHCTGKVGNVFSGKITDVGWSESKALLEFSTTGFSGWACDQGWCTSSERLYFNMNSGKLGLASAIKKGKDWSNTAHGTAVIPVPAAAWLFGSGLVGLVGVARRKAKN